MWYIHLLEPIDDKISRVRGIHYYPFDEQYGLGKTEEELRQEGHLIDAEPFPIPDKEGFDIELRFDTTTGIVFYEYVEELVVETPPIQTEQEKIQNENT